MTHQVLSYFGWEDWMKAGTQIQVQVFADFPTDDTAATNRHLQKGNISEIATTNAFSQSQHQDIPSQVELFLLRKITFEF